MSRLSVSTEELAQLTEEVACLKGRVETLTRICELLVATHPKGAKFAEILSIKANEVATLDHPTPHLQAYAEGVTRFGLEYDTEEVLAQIANDQFRIIFRRGGQK